MKSEYAIRNKLREIKGSLQDAQPFDEVGMAYLAGTKDIIEWILHEEIKLEGFERDKNNPDSENGIWDIYKIYNRTRKSEAKKKWLKMDKYSRDLAVKYAERFCKEKPFESWNQPALVVYLNKNRWEDIIEKDKIELEEKSPCQLYDKVDEMLNKSWNDQ